MTEIVARMETILTTNTYVNAQGATVNFQTDIGTRVEEGRTNWDQNELPAISIFQGTVTIDREQSSDEDRVVCRVMPVMIQCTFAQSDATADTGTMVRKVLSDIHAAIRVDMKWSVAGVPQALRTDEISHGPEYKSETYEIIGTQTAIEIRYFAPHFSMED